MPQTITQIIETKLQEPSRGRESEAIMRIERALTNDLKVLELQGQLNDFTQYMAVTALVTQCAGGFSTDHYDTIDRAHQLAWLGDLLRRLQEPFTIAYSPKFNPR